VLYREILNMDKSLEIRSKYPFSASLVVTENCNLRCDYCFEKNRYNKSMKEEVVKDSINYLVNNYKKCIELGVAQKEEKIGIILFGGEPTLNYRALREVLNCVKKFGSDLFNINLITNGTILSDELEELLVEYYNNLRGNFSIQLSIDGVKDSHDINRVDVNGNGSFSKIEENMPKWKRILEKSNFGLEEGVLNIHSCFNKKNLKYLYESYLLFIEEWGIVHWWFLPVGTVTWDEEDLLVYEQEVHKIYEHMIDYIKQTKSLDVVKGVVPFNKGLKTRPLMKQIPCGAGRGFISISAEGLIHPCHQFLFNDTDNFDYSVGDIYTGVNADKNKIYAEYGVEDLQCYKDCGLTDCYICIADNYFLRGSILSTKRSIRCKMSLIDYKYSNMVSEVCKSMGLIESGDIGASACLCDVRSGENNKSKIDSNRECKNDKCCECKNDELDLTISQENFLSIIKDIIIELKFIKEIQESILKKLI